MSCSATDAAGNKGTGSFSVHVRGASEQLDVLAGAVGGVGPGTGLTDKVDLAASALADGDPGTRRATSSMRWGAR